MSAGLSAVAAITLLLVGVWVLRTPPEPLSTHPFFAEPGPRVIAHRGGRALGPENTLFTFRRAAALGVDVLEMDIHRAADGAIVVLHDDTVDRTTDGSGAVATLGQADLRRLDAGYRWTADEGLSLPFRGQGIGVPTLDEVFAALPQVRMNIEIKDGAPTAAPLCALIREHRMQRKVLVVAVPQDAIDAFRSACPEVATGASRNEVARFVACSTLRLPGCLPVAAQALQVPERLGRFELLTPRFLAEARRLRIAVEVWTVNEPEAMQRLYALPVAGVMTDRPDRALQLLGR